MLKSKSFLCGDFGAGTLKIVEFEPSETGSLRLKQYATRSLGLEGSQESNRQATLVAAIQQLLAEKGFVSRDINICAAGFTVFSKFVKLPQMETAKVGQVIHFEAQQNVPFPLEEVVWDYQILGAAPSGELEVLLVAIKSDVVEGLFQTSEEAGLNLHLVDASPAALCNAFRYNYGDEEGCTMLLDIGAKTSNLLFFEKGKVFSRGINIGANAITQDFAAESKLPFPEAEQVKISQGFVSLGGAYAEPDDPHQAIISKIARQVMTRLHIQMNQTIQFYRGQQGGSAPTRLYLAGGASLMPFTVEFFTEKLNMPVEYFNPLRNIEMDESLDLEQVAQVAHTLGEVVGLGIRNLANCPVELNLMPPSVIKRRIFDQKKPYFMAAIFSMVLVVFAYGWFYQQQASYRKEQVAKLKEAITPLQQKESELTASVNALAGQIGVLNTNVSFVSARNYWPRLMTGIQQLLLQYETITTAEYKTNAPGTETGVWIESLETLVPEQAAAPAAGRFQGTPGAVAPAAAAGAVTVVSARAPSTIYYLKAKFRAVNLNRVAPDANTKFVFGLEKAFQTNGLFAAQNTKLFGTMDSVEPTALTFGFTMTLQLQTKDAIRLY
ncbi:MAG: type IV pilus assembly protein PilM [Verrucomicrobiota bacterium]